MVQIAERSDYVSRQYNEYIEGRFDLYGIEYRLIEPENVEEFIRAREVKAILETYINGLMHNEDSSGYENLLQEQTDYIQKYIESLGEFDSGTLAANIAFLSKKNGMRVGELEETLGISTGYISRTIKENSKKKMSIDNVWKIARLFSTDIRTLTETQMWTSHGNTDLLIEFLERLYQDTCDNYFTWESDGGFMMVLSDRYRQMGIVTEEEDDTAAVYHPQTLNPDIKWILSGDIMNLECFEGKKDLVIIPFKAENKKQLQHYDFLLIWEDEGRWCWEKVFYTSDDPFGNLDKSAEKLYKLIEDTGFDAKLSPKVYQMITSYVKGSRSK